MYKRLYRYIQTDGAALRLPAVITVIYGNKTDAEERKYTVQIIPYFNQVPAETRKVLDYDAVYRLPCKGKQLLYAGAGKSGPAVSIVAKLKDAASVKLPVAADIITEQAALVPDAEALPCMGIFAGKTHI